MKSNILKSFFLFVLSALPGFFLALFLFFEQVRMFDSNDGFFRVAGYGIPGFLGLVCFVVFLGLINPDFKPRDFSFKRFWRGDRIFVTVRILEYFLVSMFLIALVSRLLMSYSLLLASFSGGMLFWIFWHKDGVFGNLKNFEYQKGVSPWNFSPNLRRKNFYFIILRGALFGLILVAMQKLIFFVLDYPQLLSSFLISYRQWFTPYDHSVYFFLAFSLSGFILPFSHAISDFSPKNRSRLIVPAVLAIIFGLIIYRQNVILFRAVDLDKNAFSLAGFDLFKAEKKTLYIFDANGVSKRGFESKVTFRAIDLDRRVSNVPGDPRLVFEEVPCSEKNRLAAEKLFETAQKKDFKTTFFNSYLTYSSGKGGFQTLYGCDLFNFNVEAILRDRMLAGEEDFENDSMTIFSNEIARVAQSGDMGVFKGKVRGKIDFGGNFYNVKVALLKKQEEGQQRMGISAPKLKEGLFLEGFSLMAAVSTDKHGSFVLENVIHGNYFLALLVEGENDFTFIIKDNPLPGEIILNEKKSTWDIGVIRIMSVEN